MLISHFALPRDRNGDLHPPCGHAQWPGRLPHHVNPLHCKILGTSVQGRRQLRMLGGVDTHGERAAREPMGLGWSPQRAERSPGAYLLVKRVKPPEAKNI